MKKEFFALALLIALFAGGLYNTHYIHGLTDGLSDELELSRIYCQNGEYTLALERAEAAAEAWDNCSLYARIFIRHTEIDSVDYGLHDLTAVLTSEEPEGAAPLYASLIAHIESLYEMERLSLGSIF